MNYMGQQQKPKGYVVVTLNGMDKEWYVVESYNDKLWEALDRTWHSVKESIDEKGETINLVRVPESHVTYKEDKFLRASPCLFTASKEYCENRFGIKLDKDDDDFYQEHPYVDKDGTPQPYTLRVVQELIDPHGLRISRVVMAPGATVLGDLLQWQDVLGCNPLATLDRVTTNAEFAKLTEQAPETVKQENRFEFGALLLRPAITCGAFSDALEASGGGHAQYAGPRKKGMPSILQFQIERAEFVKWYKEPVFPELPAKPYPKTVNVFDIVTPDKKHTMQEIVSQLWKESYSSHSSGASIVGSGAGGVGGKCNICSNTFRANEKSVRSRVCSDCWAAFVAPYCCPKCHHAYRDGAPELKQISLESHKGTDKGYRVDIACPKCSASGRISGETEPLARIVSVAINFTGFVPMDDWNSFQAARETHFKIVATH